MINIETRIELANSVLGENLRVLAISDLPTVKRNAGFLLEQQASLGLFSEFVPSNSTNIVDAELVISHDSVKVEDLYTMQLCKNVSKVLMSSRTEIQARLVLASSLAKDYFEAYNSKKSPHYGERLNTVYARAIDIQRDWLDYENLEGVTNDPRNCKTEELTSRYIGEKEEFLDCGFEDFVHALLDWEADHNATLEERQKLEHFKNSPGTLISMREAVAKSKLICPKIAQEADLVPLNTRPAFIASRIVDFLMGNEHKYMLAPHPDEIAI